VCLVGGKSGDLPHCYEPTGLVDVVPREDIMAERPSGHRAGDEGPRRIAEAIEKANDSEARVVRERVDRNKNKAMALARR